MTVADANLVLSPRKCDSSETEAEAAVFQELQKSTARFSLFWLASANLVGLLLALLLVCPQIGVWLGEFSYGRWVALHLNWHLYGWCSLPAVGALLRRYLRPTHRGLEQARKVFWGWSIALALGGLSWLEGQRSGKLFLDWMGLARIFFVFAMTFFWAVLGWNFWQGWQRRRRTSVSRGSPLEWMLDIVMLVTLSAVPWILYWSSGREIYPAIDPGTGGPTGASLLGSTLGIVLIFALVPWLLAVPGNPGIRWKPFWICFAVDTLLWAAISHGNSSHWDWRQFSALGSLIIWVPLLALYWGRFAWNRESRCWLKASLAWWALLLITGIVAFLPGVLDQIKFTHVLVAHSHLAMAGFLTNANMLVLSHLSNPASPTVKFLARPVPFFVWQLGLALHLACLIAIGVTESVNPERWFMGSLTALLWLRLGAGVLMAAVSLYWATAAYGICEWSRPAERVGE